MSSREIKAIGMRPGRRYTIEIPSDFAGRIDTAYDDPMWTDRVGVYGNPNTAPLGVSFQSITLRFSQLNHGSSGLKVIEHIDWENGAVYKSKHSGKLYMRRSDGWLVLPASGSSSYYLEDSLTK